MAHPDSNLSCCPPDPERTGLSLAAVFVSGRRTLEEAAAASRFALRVSGAVLVAVALLADALKTPFAGWGR